MKKFYFAAMALLFSVSLAFAQCPTTSSVSNIRLNNVLSNTITVQPNATFSVSLTYNIGNQTSCPGCISQLVMGLGATALDCIYAGTPALCPAGTTGNFSRNVTAPVAPGIYRLNWQHVQEFSCDDAKTNYPTRGRTPFATVIVCSGQDIITNVRLNGGGDNVSVQGGATVNMALNYQVSNETVFPTAIKQVVYGLENTALDCIYNGVPPACPNSTSGEYTTSFTAPTTPGNYAIYKNQHLQFTCDDAKALYASTPKTQIGIVTVLPPQGVAVTFKVNIVDYLATGATLSPNGMRIAGNFAARGAKNGVANMVDWTPTDANGAMTRLSDDIWQVTITYPDTSRGRVQLFKFVNGDWGPGNNENDQDLINCGDDDGFGAFNRTYVVPTSSRTVTYCWDRCSSTCLGGTITSGIEKLSTNQSISLQPNPVQNSATLTFQHWNSTNADIQIFDMKGRSVHAAKYAVSDNAASLNLEELPKGVYLLRATNSDGKSKSIRFGITR